MMRFLFPARPNLPRSSSAICAQGQIRFKCNVPVTHPFIKISEEVRAALDSKRPVVALETTIYTHGFPYPDNVALASHLESVVRVNGGVPATIGILNGIARVGFGAEELIELTASAGMKATYKVSRRDLSYICGLGSTGHKMNGGTTVSATMILAQLAGIQVFATGGLGGVHRGGESTLDISADLTELGRTALAVVSSGCKSFLDIPRTLEYLETQGVAVMTLADGRDGDADFPAFWSRDSGIKSPLTIRSERDAAAIVFAHSQFALSSGILFANPVPEEHSIPIEGMNIFITQALRDAEIAGVYGSRTTPFVLNRIREITNGATVVANRALVESNVAVGTKLAVEIARLNSLNPENSGYLASVSSDPRAMNSGQEHVKTSHAAPHFDHNSSSTRPRIVVAGAIAIDTSCDFQGLQTADEVTMSTSNPASISQSLGGVACNVAIALHYRGVEALLCSKVGRDISGSTALTLLDELGLSNSGIVQSTEGSRTAQYIACNDHEKSLVLAMADMDILQRPTRQEDEVHDMLKWEAAVESSKPAWLVVDANWSSERLHRWLAIGEAKHAKIAYEPVSASKSTRLFDVKVCPSETISRPIVHLASPNVIELAAMCDSAETAGLMLSDYWFETIDKLGLPSSGSRDRFVHLTNNTLVDEGIPQQSIRLLPFISCIVTTLGERGVLLTQILNSDDERLTSPAAAPYILASSISSTPVYMRLFPPPRRLTAEEIVSVNGIGDTFLGVLIAEMAKHPSLHVEDLINMAQEASILTLKSREAVNPDIRMLRRL